MHRTSHRLTSTWYSVKASPSRVLCARPPHSTLSRTFTSHGDLPLYLDGRSIFCLRHSLLDVRRSPLCHPLPCYQRSSPLQRRLPVLPSRPDQSLQNYVARPSPMRRVQMLHDFLFLKRGIPVEGSDAWRHRRLFLHPGHSCLRRTCKVQG